MLIVRAMRTVEDTATEAAAVSAATTHQRATTGRHLVVDHNHDRDHDQPDRSTTIHLPTTPYHPVTIAADTNNNHDHHRNYEHHAAQRHDHWNKCKSSSTKKTKQKKKKKWEKTKQRPWDRPIIVGKFIVYEEIVQCSLMAGWLWLKGGGGGDGGGDGGINGDYR